MPAPVSEPVRRNIQTVRDLEAESVGRRTRAERVSDAVTAFAGSFRFLAAEAAAIAGWVLLNEGLGGLPAFDPYPYQLLNFAVGVQAVVLSTFVLISQNRQTRQAEQWGHIQLQVSLLGEQEATKMLQMLRLLCARLRLEKAAADPELAQMIRTTHVEELADELEKAREAPPEG